MFISEIQSDRFKRNLFTLVVHRIVYLKSTEALPPLRGIDRCCIVFHILIQKGLHCKLFFQFLGTTVTSLLSRSIVRLSDLAVAREGLCRIDYGLSNRQYRFCQRNKQLMPIIRLGVKLALEECQIQFQHRHWNCSLFDERDLLGNVLDSGLRVSSSRIN